MCRSILSAGKLPSVIPDNVTAVLFDLDDTLCVYVAAAIRARREALTELAAPKFDLPLETIDKAYMNRFKEVRKLKDIEPWLSKYLKSGEPTRTETFRLAFSDLGLEDAAFARQVGDRYLELRERYIELYPDALPVLRALAPQYKLGIITNGPADTQREEIRRLGIEGWFQAILIEGEYGVGKPDAAIFLEACRRMEAQPRDALFVGNSWEHDAMGAVGAGLCAVWLNRTGEEGQRDDRVVEIRSLLELIPG